MPAVSTRISAKPAACSTATASRTADESAAFARRVASERTYTLGACTAFGRMRSPSRAPPERLRVGSTRSSAIGALGRVAPEAAHELVEDAGFARAARAGDARRPGRGSPRAPRALRAARRHRRGGSPQRSSQLIVRAIASGSRRRQSSELSRARRLRRVRSGTRGACSGPCRRGRACGRPRA